MKKEKRDRVAKIKWEKPELHDFKVEKYEAHCAPSGSAANTYPQESCINGSVVASMGNCYSGTSANPGWCWTGSGA